MDADALRDEAQALGWWYHNVELAPGVWTNPAAGEYPAARHFQRDPGRCVGVGNHGAACADPHPG